MIDQIAIVTKFINVLKKFFKRMMLRNTAKNALFDRERRQIFNLSSFTFAISVSTSIVSSLNQFLNLELLKSIKTLKKRTKRSREIAKDVQRIILILFI